MQGRAETREGMEIQVLGDLIRHDDISPSVSCSSHSFSQRLHFIFRERVGKNEPISITYIPGNPI